MEGGDDKKQIACTNKDCRQPWKDWKGHNGIVWISGVMVTGRFEARCPHCGQARVITSRLKMEG